MSATQHPLPSPLCDLERQLDAAAVARWGRVPLAEVSPPLALDGSDPVPSPDLLREARRSHAYVMVWHGWERWEDGVWRIAYLGAWLALNAPIPEQRAHRLRVELVARAAAMGRELDGYTYPADLSSEQIQCPACWGSEEWRQGARWSRPRIARVLAAVPEGTLEYGGAPMRCAWCEPDQPRDGARDRSQRRW